MDRQISLREDRKQNINLLNDLSETKKYSKYSKELNKIFSFYSYKKFLNGLKRLEEKKVISNKDTIESLFNSSNPTKLKKYKEFDIEKFKLNLKKMKLKELAVLTKKKKYYDKILLNRKLLLDSTKNRLLKIKNKEKLFEVPGIGKYNPKYDAISKHTFQVVFERQNYYDFNNLNTDKNSSSLDKTKSSFRVKTINTNSTCERYFKTFEKTINRAQTQSKMTTFNKSNDTFSGNKKLKYNKTLTDNFNDSEKQIRTIQNMIQKNEEKFGNNLDINNFNVNKKKLFFQKFKKKNEKKINKTNYIISNSYSTKDKIYNNAKNRKKNIKNELYIKNNISNLKKNITKNKKNEITNKQAPKNNNNSPLGIYEPNYSPIFSRTSSNFLSNRKKNNIKMKLFINSFNYNKNEDGK